MKRFQFRLEPLLQYREYLMQNAQQEVARIRSELLACEEQIFRLEKDYVETSETLDKEISTGIDVKRYRHYTSYLERVESNKASENLHRIELLAILEEKQKHLAQRSIDKKVLENLKSRRRDDYYREMMNTVYKESDDAMILRVERSANR